MPETEDILMEAAAALRAATTQMKAYGERLTGIEQKMDRHGGHGGGRVETKSLGSMIADSPDLAEYVKAGAKGRVRLEVKTINTAMTSDGASAGALAPPDRSAEPDLLPQRPLMVRDLLRPGTTTSNVVQIPKQTTRTNNAATVAENPGSPKPQSDLDFTLVDYPVRTVAHWIRASKQVLADAPVLKATINSELLFGLKDVEDTQLLMGDGTGTNLLGLMPQASAYNASVTGLAEPDSATRADRLRLAILQARLALFPATGIVLNPVDVAALDLQKDTQGHYIFTDTSKMWRIPVAETEAMAPNNFLVGAFGLGAQLFDREESAVYISTEDGDNFTRNLCTILAEERLALAVRRPTAFVKGNFTFS